MITRIDNLFKSCLQSYFEDTDIRVDYVSAPIWEFNEKDRIGTNPIMFLSLPLRNSVNTTKSGNETDNYILQLFFLKHTPFTEDQLTRTPVVDEMRALCETIIKEYIAENPLIEISNKRVYDDVYNLLDQNFSGIQVVFEFQYTDDCQPLEDVIETTGDNLLLYAEGHLDIPGSWVISFEDGRLRYTHPDINDTDAQHLDIASPDCIVAGQDYLFTCDVYFGTPSGKLILELGGVEHQVSQNQAGRFSAIVTASDSTDITPLEIHFNPFKNPTGSVNNFIGYVHNPSLRKIK